MTQAQIKSLERAIETIERLQSTVKNDRVKDCLGKGKTELIRALSATL